MANMQRPPFQSCEPEDQHIERTSPKGNLMMLRLVTQDGDHVKSEVAPQAPTDEELDGWIDRLKGMPAAYDARSALWRMRVGMELPGRDGGAPPVDLWQRHEAPDLPKGLLPAVIERFAFGHAEIMGADPAGLAMSALAVCAGAIPDTVALQVKQFDTGWRENARLWIALVGQPSTMKSPIVNAAMKPLQRLDAALVQKNDEAMRSYLALPKAEQAMKPRPKQPRLVAGDTTVEGLQITLTDSPHGVLAKYDELSGWFGSMDKHSPGKGAMADRAFWLEANNGGPYSVTRVVRGSTLIPNLSVTVLGGIQPDLMRRLAADSVDDGLIQRFLPIVLRTASIGRDAPTGEAAATYERLAERLTKLAPPRSGNLGTGQPVLLSAEARTIRERIEVEHASLVRALETVSPKLAAHFGKLNGIFARLCLLWHCVETDGDLPTEVSADVAERVARFMAEFLRPNAIAFYTGTLGMSAGHEDLMALASLIVSEGLSEVSAREVQRSMRALRSITADDVRRLCENLAAFGWLWPTSSNAKGQTTRWKVVPEVHMMFAERGRQESERRIAARAAVAEVFRA